MPSHRFTSEVLSFIADCDGVFTGARRCLSVVWFLLKPDTDVFLDLEYLVPQRRKRLEPDGPLVCSNTSIYYGDARNYYDDWVTEVELYAGGKENNSRRLCPNTICVNCKGALELTASMSLLIFTIIVDVIVVSLLVAATSRMMTPAEQVSCHAPSYLKYFSHLLFCWTNSPKRAQNKSASWLRSPSSWRSSSVQVDRYQLHTSILQSISIWFRATNKFKDMFIARFLNLTAFGEEVGHILPTCVAVRKNVACTSGNRC